MDNKIIRFVTIFVGLLSFRRVYLTRNTWIPDDKGRPAENLYPADRILGLKIM
jgi:hypothetical protein